jgi:diacylglycerol kinase family enzyme
VVGTPIARLAPHIHPDDGQVDVVVVRADTIPRLLRTVLNVILGRQRQDPDLHFLVAQRTIMVDAGRSLPTQADGEPLGWTPIRMELVPNALRVIVPR